MAVKKPVVVMTARDYVIKHIHIARDLNTKYKNVYPYNLGYYNDDDKYSWDCWNLPKSLIWRSRESDISRKTTTKEPALRTGQVIRSFLAARQ